MNGSLHPAVIRLPGTTGFLHIGAQLGLRSCGSNGLLSLDMSEETSLMATERPGFSVVSSKVASHPYGVYSRSILRVERARASDLSPDETDVCYGDRLVFWFNLEGQSPFYLHSELLTPTSTSKVSRRQLVAAVQGIPAREETWEILPADNRDRLQLTLSRQPVKLTDQVCLRHVATGCLLASDSRVTQQTVFGREHEVCCHSEKSRNKSHNLKLERSGHIDGDSPTRLNVSESIWTFFV